jgi:hypothetical protein
LEYEDPDWNKLFWQIQRYFPNDTRFNWENFGDQPEWLIYQAFEQGKRQVQEFLYGLELPIASFHSTYYNAHLDTKKNSPVKVKNLCYFLPKESSGIPSIVGDTFFSLVREEIIPRWALAIAPINELRNLKTGFKPSYPRAVWGDGVIVFNPQIKGDWLEGSFALICEAKEQVILSSPDDISLSITIECNYEGRNGSIQVIEPEMRIICHG